MALWTPPREVSIVPPYTTYLLTFFSFQGCYDAFYDLFVSLAKPAISITALLIIIEVCNVINVNVRANILASVPVLNLISTLKAQNMKIVELQTA